MRAWPQRLTTPRGNHHRGIRELSGERFQRRSPEVPRAPAHLHDFGVARICAGRVIAAVGTSKDG
eukprot:6339620-Alexandrium_andersonii.AAC.2